MGHPSQYVVVHQDAARDSSVSSWATQTSGYSSTSNPSSEDSVARSERYRDPLAENHYVDVTKRKGPKGDVVVVNHHKRSKETKGPSPNYSHASVYSHSSGSRH